MCVFLLNSSCNCRVLKKDKDEGIQKHEISRPLSVHMPSGDEKTEVVM